MCQTDHLDNSLTNLLDNSLSDRSSIREFDGQDHVLPTLFPCPSSVGDIYRQSVAVVLPLHDQKIEGSFQALEVRMHPTTTS